MQKKLLFLFMLSAACCLDGFAQRTDKKIYPAKTMGGDVYLLTTYGEMVNGVASKVYIIDVPTADSYFFSSLSAMLAYEKMEVYVDGVDFETIYAERGGWQNIGTQGKMTFSKGKHEIRIIGQTSVVPMIEEISLTSTSSWKGMPAPGLFLDKVKQLEKQAFDPGLSDAAMNAKVLSNPQGTYYHAIDTSFWYSHFSTVHLTAGNHTLTTANSNGARVLSIFNAAQTSSWATTGGGPNGESFLFIIVPTTGFYTIMLRSYNNSTGISDILLDNVLIHDNVVFGGRTIGMPVLKGGLINFFTSHLAGSADTRIVVSRYSTSSARGYNDDYNGPGDFNWGLTSRVLKNFTNDSVQYTFVCAYSPSSTGLCDIYMGNTNSNVYSANYPEFPLLHQDDAIEAAPSSGYYNCISWSGGITATWVWPPGSFSTYNCTSSYSDVSCFDHFYANTPPRYPGAWNYTRSGATSSNATVDLWKLAPNYTHASVHKPGNNHPHGFDWESKPGGLTRTFHPRNDLANSSYGYGVVTDYYRATGTYAARGVTQSYATDADAVKAGVAVFENAQLTGEASKKLSGLVEKTNSKFVARYNELYEAWKKTWEKNALYSDPSMYCKNDEFKALAEFSNTDPVAAIFITADKFVTANDHLIGDLLWSLTKEKYGKLLQEVKDERAANPKDKEGRYRVHGDHDNGVLYVEKILKDYAPVTEVKMEESGITFTVMPNPVRDVLTVKLTLITAEKVTIKVTSSQTQASRVMLAETMVAAGVHQYRMPVSSFVGPTGDLLTIQVITAKGVKTVKAMVVR